MAIIKINDLKVRTLIGAYPLERVNKQEITLNITLEYDAAAASRSDKLKDALNYETLAAKAVKIAQGRHTLLEKLVSKILAGIMADKRVMKATVRVDKPHACAYARCVSCELSAER
ncbi:MAG: dihydroneopterin aldolase [Candidatus Omnitrophica bacterium]|nr:dihydroneopterin aldolase [Candidatus Omnitrophota bacterium]